MTEKNTIHQAIVAAMAEVHILGKDGKNTHQNYKFASIDAFLAMVNPIARKHGVFINITEIEDVELVAVKERNGESLFGRFVYGISASGAAGDSLEQSKQTVFLRFVGPQTTGQALAYAMKMYLRMLLLIPTGDADADLQEQVSASGLVAATITADQFIELRDKIAKAGVDEAKIVKAYGVAQLDDLKAADFTSAMTRLELTLKAASSVEEDTIPYGGK